MVDGFEINLLILFSAPSRIDNIFTDLHRSGLLPNAGKRSLTKGAKDRCLHSAKV